MVLTSTHSLCFEQKYEKYQRFLSENCQFLEVKFSIYLNRHVFVMNIINLLEVVKVKELRYTNNYGNYGINRMMTIQEST